MGFKEEWYQLQNNSFWLFAKFLEMYSFLSICIQNLQKSVSMTYIFSSKLVWAMAYQKTKNFIQIPIRWNGQKSPEKSYKK